MSLRPEQFEKIMSMDAEKRNRVLNSAMAEFSKGYKRASTGTMAAAAGISKGLLFHYFGTKRQLLHYTFTYTFDILIRAYSGKLDKAQPDFLIRLLDITKIKLDLLLQWPASSAFMAAVYTNNDDDFADIKSEMLERYEETKSFDGSWFFDGVDYSMFRPDIDPKMAVNTVMWSFKAYSESLFEKQGNIEGIILRYNEIIQTVEQYSEFFRKILYRQDAQGNTDRQ